MQRGRRWPVVVAVAGVLLATGGAARLAIARGPDPIPSTAFAWGSPTGAPPATLADGSPLGEVPAEVAGRFTGPVVGGRLLPELPASAGDCLVPWWEQDATREWAADPLWAWHGDAQAVARWRELVDDPSGPAAWLGPDGLAAFWLAPADAPPGWPDAITTTCAARWQEEGWDAEFVDFAHALPTDGGWSHMESDAPLWSVFLDVPAGTAWAVQDRGGWWLAQPVAGAPRVAFTLPGTPRPLVDEWPTLTTRVVLLDGDGAVLADRAVTPDWAGPPEAHPHAADAVLDIGGEGEVRAALAAAPLHRCHEPSGLCVWVVDDGGALLALAAAGSHPLSVPPLGDVGWCPSNGWFESSWVASQFDPRGGYLLGPDRHGLDRYAVRVDAGRVLVDLAAWEPGPPRPPGGPSGNAGMPGEECYFVDGPIGVPGSVVDRMVQARDQRGERGTATWTAPAGGLTLDVAWDGDRLAVTVRRDAADPG